MKPRSSLEPYLSRAFLREHNWSLQERKLTHPPNLQRSKIPQRSPSLLEVASHLPKSTCNASLQSQGSSFLSFFHFSLSLYLSPPFFLSPPNAMEPADVDWKNIDSRYECDELYEHINAPKWLDLTAPDAPVDDVAWFCRTGCRHPNTAEDFNRLTTSPKLPGKLLRSNSAAIQPGDQTHNYRDANLKRRGGIPTFFQSPRSKSNSKKYREDLENQNPNIGGTPPTMKGKKVAAAMEEAIKSSKEKEGVAAEEARREVQSKRTQPQPPRLKSTFSARNLFSGKDILGQISEFCNELKKMASRRETATAAAAQEEEKNTLMERILEEDNEKACSKDNVDGKKKTMNSNKKNGSLVKKSELSVRFCSSVEKSKILKEVRASPPTPQRFPSPSNNHYQLQSSKASADANSSPLCILPKSKTAAEGSSEDKRELITKNEECNRASVASEAEGSSVDVFWFLKPCTYLVD